MSQISFRMTATSRAAGMSPIAKEAVGAGTTLEAVLHADEGRLGLPTSGSAGDPGRGAAGHAAKGSTNETAARFQRDLTETQKKNHYLSSIRP